MPITIFHNPIEIIIRDHFWLTMYMHRIINHPLPTLSSATCFAMTALEPTNYQTTGDMRTISVPVF
jgi:hypothetical protein